MKVVTEAGRYLENARSLLRDKAKKEEGYYQDPRYVRMAGHTAYSVVLIALDAALAVQKKGRKKMWSGIRKSWPPPTRKRWELLLPLMIFSTFLWDRWRPQRENCPARATRKKRKP